MNQHIQSQSRFRPALALMNLVLIFVLMLAAGLLNSRFRFAFGLREVSILGRREEFHVLGHLVIFASLALMVALWAAKPHRLWITIVLALTTTFLIEGIQLLTVDVPFSRVLIYKALFDVVVNSAGLALGLKLVDLFDWVGNALRRNRLAVSGQSRS